MGGMPLTGLETEAMLVLERGPGTDPHGGAITCTASLWTPQEVTLQLGGGGRGQRDLGGASPHQALRDDATQGPTNFGSSPMLLQCKPCHASIKSHFVHFLTKLHLIGSLKFWGVIPFLAFPEQIQIWVLVKKQMKVTQTCWFLSLVLFYFLLVRLHLQLLTNQKTDF